MAAGSISATEFRTFAIDFLSKSDVLGDDWILKKASNGEPYLYKRSTIHYAGERDGKTETVDSCQKVLEDMVTDDEADSACLLGKGANSVNTYEYHITYSESYAVPVLYFNVYKQDGRLLNLSEVWSRVPVYYRERLEAERWTFITQQEHPDLGRPFFQLHPCHTGALMSKIPSVKTDSSRNYLVAWLSAVGPVVGLKLQIGYAQVDNT